MSGLFRVIRRVHRRVVGAPERGTTMVELMVGMVIMGICGSIFTVAVVTLQRTSNQAQAITNAALQNNQAFQTLDRTVRYATAISSPATSSGTGDWYVELRTTTGGTEQCTQLRVDLTSKQLQRRTWTPSDATTIKDVWTPLATSITNGAAALDSDTQPFRLIDATTSGTHQSLRFVLVSTAGPPGQLNSSTSKFALTALNSAATATGSVCQQAGRP